jgi:hypothetical protein
MRGRKLPPQSEDDELLEFLRAMDAFRRRMQRPYPNLNEVFGILTKLGWGKPGLSEEEAQNALSKAITALKKRSGESFPTWSEILSEIRRRGWSKASCLPCERGSSLTR